MKEEIFGNLEFPINDTRISKAASIVSGWAFSSSGKHLSIKIYVNENLIDEARWGLPRYDVFNKYHNDDGYESGFIARINLRSVSDGVHTIKVIADSNQNQKILGDVKFIKEKRKISEIGNPVLPVPAGSPGYYKKWGKKHLEYFIKFGNLKPHYKVLEIGSGMGQMTLPITKFLNSKGEYLSLDIIPNAINYCKKHISTRFKNFKFIHADVYNKMYNPNGQYNACDYKFPFENESFDFVFLTSVFTHMVLNDVKNYLSEISRVLKTNHRCFITAYLLNNESKNLIDAGLSKFDFQHKFEGYFSIDEKIPEKAIGFDELLIKKLFQKSGLQIFEPIRYGTWSGRDSDIEGQDIIILKKL